MFMVRQANEPCHVSTRLVGPARPMGLAGVYEYTRPMVG